MASEFLRDFSFDKLIAPIRQNAFFDEYWENQVLVVQRQAPSYYGDLLTIPELDNAVATAPGRLGLVPHSDEGSTDIQFADNTATLNEMALTELRRGGTLVLGHVEERLPNLALICRLLGREFGFRSWAAVYMTPPGSHAFKAHFDQTEVFVLQVLGSKLWRTSTARRLFPRTEEFDSGDTEIGPDHQEHHLRQGDLLYIPRGFVHDARSIEEPSVHITLRLEPPSWEDLIKATVKLAADGNDALKRALPVGFLNRNSDELVGGLAARLAEIAAPEQLGRAAALFADEYVTRFSPDIAGQVQTVFGGAGLGPDDRIGPRRGLVYRLHEADDTITLRVGFRSIAFPDVLADQLRFALETPSFAIRDLPGDLTDDEKVVFIERLVQEGLIERKDDQD
jgi:ribosomal protein L16 Arg81 hydroxylase